MPRIRKDPNTVRVTPLVKWLLGDLVTKLATTKPVLSVSEAELAGALIYAARRSPPEAVKANVGAYRDYEFDFGPEFAAAEVVCRFFVQFGRV
jgi:hypothetical protein